jgi:hypothetical protein
LFNLASTHDLLCASDYLTVDDGTIVYQSVGKTRLMGRRLTDIGPWDMWNDTKDYGPAIALDLKVSGYFLNSGTRGRDDFVQRFYGSIKASWADQIRQVPTFDVHVSMPPLVAVVLDRAANRQNIPQVIADLRDELAEIRAELCEFDHLARDIRSQAEAENFSRKLFESFLAIVPESRVDRGFKPLAKVWQLGRPIMTAYSMVTNPTLLAPDKLEALLGEVRKAVTVNSSLVDRTHTSAKFAELLRTENIFRLVARHFSAAEIKVLCRAN